MKSSCVIEFEGLNINQLLNSLVKDGIVVLSVTRQGKRCVLHVQSRHLRKVVALLEEKCYNIINIRRVGIANTVKQAQKHFALPLAIVAAVLLIFVSSQICFRIEVEGDFDRELICAALSDAGIKVGARLDLVDVDAAENCVSNSVGAMYTVINRKGSVIYVNAVAKKQIDAPVDMRSRRDLVATQSGIVTSVLCEQGTLLVKVGDVVKQGDVLIEGRRIFNDGTSQDVYALGLVTVEISATGFCQYDGYKTVAQPTENVFKSVGVVLFGKEYSKTCPFENFTLDVTYCCLSPLNLQICVKVYNETKQMEVSAPIEECLDELKCEAKNKAMLQCGFDVEKEVYTVTDNGVEAKLLGTVIFR